MPIVEPRRGSPADENRATLERALVLLEQAVSVALGDASITSITVRLPVHGRKLGRPMVAVEGHEVPV